MLRGRCAIQRERAECQPVTALVVPHVSPRELVVHKVADAPRVAAPLFGRLARASIGRFGECRVKRIGHALPVIIAAGNFGELAFHFQCGRVRHALGLVQSRVRPIPDGVEAPRRQALEGDRFPFLEPVRAVLAFQIGRVELERPALGKLDGQPHRRFPTRCAVVPARGSPAAGSHWNICSLPSTTVPPSLALTALNPSEKKRWPLGSPATTCHPAAASGSSPWLRVAVPRPSRRIHRDPAAWGALSTRPLLWTVRQRRRLRFSVFLSIPRAHIGPMDRQSCRRRLPGRGGCYRKPKSAALPAS